MGTKRPLEDEDFPEPSFRRPKQLDYNRKLTLDTEKSHITSLRVDSPGEANSSYRKIQFQGLFEDDQIGIASVAVKGLEASAALSLGTSSSSSSDSEEDVGNEDTSDWSCFPAYIDFSIPRRPLNEFDDPYISSLNCGPRKEVPIAPDHQAEVPLWDPYCSRNFFSGSNCFADNDREKRLIGTCVIPMPDLSGSTMEGVRVGRGRTDCSCMDVGSMRCVQQHVNEEREKLRETIGDEKLLELGFCYMGDEVAHKWTPDDEHVFHEVVFSNPVSHGRKFWKHLSAAFPTRTMKELVSYYFNVFMLRRRAVQNRSYLLEIDSDNDEEPGDVDGDLYQNGSHSFDPDTDIDDDQQGSNGECYIAGGDEEDFTVESFDDQDLDASWVDDFWSEPQNVCVDEGSNLNQGTSDSKVEKQNVEMKARTEIISGKDAEKLYDDPRFYS